MISIRLGHTLESMRPSLHNGPGWRINIWFQGCSLRCTDSCLTPHLLSPKGGYLFTVKDVVEEIKKIYDSSFRDIEGITILGGEPFDQLEALYEITKRLKKLGLSLMVYSGHTLKALINKKNEIIDKVLNTIDILIDGPFVSEMYVGNIMWRGSDNQGIHILSDRYSMDYLIKTFTEQKKGYSILIKPEGFISISGLQDREYADRIEKLIKK